MPYRFRQFVSMLRQRQLPSKTLRERELKNRLLKANIPVKYILLTVILPLFFLSLTEVLTPIELAFYDFNFSLRSTEPVDERIVIVEWDESNIQMLEESIISDDTLGRLIEKIKQQEPRIIGLDLYRDIPVPSPRLSNEENDLAYDRLQNLFRDTPNLIGIEKIIEPIINPSKILAEQNQVAASDLPTDRDTIVRRSYIATGVDEKGNLAGNFSFGVVLGADYLEKEGFSGKKLDNYPLGIVNEKTSNSVILKPVRNFIGAFKAERYGFSFLVNWRSGEHNFRRVGVEKVISNQIPDDFLRNRLVLIGNVSSSTADRHIVAKNRWDSFPFAYGVEIPAHVASSIISAALDGRVLLQQAPWLWELFLIVFSISIIVFVVNKYQSKNSLASYWKTFSITLLVTLFLISTNIFSFNLGWWIQITIAITGIWIAYFSLNYYFYQNEQRKNADRLELFVRQLVQHGLGTPLGAISLSLDRIKNLVGELDIELAFPEENSELVDVGINEKLEIIAERLNNIETQINKIQRNRNLVKNFIRFGYLNQKNTLKSTNIKVFVRGIVERFVEERDSTRQVSILQHYDPKLKTSKIDTIAVEIILDNLLSNAFYAVSHQDREEDYIPSIQIITKAEKGKIKFVVRDNGHGIPPHLHSSIFQPFVSFCHGQGIGLYLVRKILDLYDGDIRVESQLEVGSTFTFFLPLIS